MAKDTDLLIKLGLTHYTKRHLQLINDFIKSDEKDCKILLDKLGAWNANDLAITEHWLNEGA